MEDQENQARYVKMISESFPEVPLGKIRFLTHGWDHDVIVVDDKIIFRFPKRKEYQETFKRELKLLGYLKDKVEIPVPDYKYISPDQGFGGYEILSGHELKKENFQALSSPQRKTTAQQLGSFLTTLHDISISTTQDMGFTEKENGTYWSEEDTRNRFEQLQKLVFPKLKPDEIAWVSSRFKKYLSLKFEYHNVLIHSDLKEEHILFDPGRGSITGIIDFADAEIADPMLDFSGLSVYGKDFVELVLSYYKRPYDPDMIERSRYPKSFGGIVHMLEIVQGKVLPLSWEENYAKFRRNMQLYPD